MATPPADKAKAQTIGLMAAIVAVIGATLVALVVCTVLLVIYLSRPGETKTVAGPTEAPVNDSPGKKDKSGIGGGTPNGSMPIVLAASKSGTFPSNGAIIKDG